MFVCALISNKGKRDTTFVQTNISCHFETLACVDFFCTTAKKLVENMVPPLSNNLRVRGERQKTLLSVGFFE